MSRLFAAANKASRASLLKRIFSPATRANMDETDRAFYAGHDLRDALLDTMRSKEKAVIETTHKVLGEYNKVGKSYGPARPFKVPAFKLFVPASGEFEVV